MSIIKKITPEQFTKVNHDINGNPRYVVHFLDLININQDESIGQAYNRACKLANKAGGRKYRANSYGGGIVFQTYSLPHLCESLNNLINN